MLLCLRWRILMNIRRRLARLDPSVYMLLVHIFQILMPIEERADDCWTGKKEENKMLWLDYIIIVKSNWLRVFLSFISIEYILLLFIEKNMLCGSNIGLLKIYLHLLRLKTNIMCSSIERRRKYQFEYYSWTAIYLLSVWWICLWFIAPPSYGW